MAVAFRKFFLSATAPFMLWKPTNKPSFFFYLTVRFNKGGEGFG